jgi:hypothetical protein
MKGEQRMKFVHYPDIAISVTDLKGNSIDIVQRVSDRLRIAGVPEKEIEAFMEKATAGNKDELLNFVWHTVDVQ